MPGNPKMQAFERHVEDLGGDHVVFDQIADGKIMEDIAASFRGFYEAAPEFPSRSWIYTWIHRTEERERRWQEAKELAGHNLREDARKILENRDPETGEPTPPKTSVEQKWRKDLSDDLKRHAGQLNPKEYGDKGPDLNVNVDVGTLHLDALRQKGSMGERQVEEADYELLEDGDD